LGEALADLTLEGKTSLPVDFLRVSRPSLREGTQPVVRFGVR
jgi:hypothetical protein